MQGCMREMGHPFVVTVGVASCRRNPVPADAAWHGSSVCAYAAAAAIGPLGPKPYTWQACCGQPGNRFNAHLRVDLCPVSPRGAHDKRRVVLHVEVHHGVDGVGQRVVHHHEVRVALLQLRHHAEGAWGPRGKGNVRRAWGLLGTNVPVQRVRSFLKGDARSCCAAGMWVVCRKS